MTVDAAYVYEGLLRYNYFPMVKEHRDDIVPVFTSEDFTTDVADKLICTTGSGSGVALRKSGYDQIEYRTTRFNNVLRLMHVPHPMPFAHLCKCIYDYWDKLAFICDNKNSLIKPAYHGGRVVVMRGYDATEEPSPGRVVVMDKEQFPEDAFLHLDRSTGAQYLVEADVSACFPSLYSHAIPWALVGHNKAKQQCGRRYDDEWFNRLDKCQRSLKRNETQGVPVGPATSNIFNELILSKVDDALEKNYRFLRAIDDYKCYCSTRDEAEKFIRDLEYELGKYLLSLNAKKVSIVNLPIPRKDAWVTELSMHMPVDDKQLSATRIANALDYALALQRSHPEGSVLKYAARTLVKCLDESNIEIYLRYIIQFAYHFPVLLPIVCEAMKKFLVPLNRDRLQSLLLRHLEFRRSDAVCWSIYLICLALEGVDRSVAEKIIESGDCMAMGMLVSINEHVAMVRDFVRSLDGKHPYELDKYWLLIYELTRCEDLNTTELGGYYSQSGFDVLANEGVQFIKSPSVEGLNRKRIGFPEID